MYYYTVTKLKEHRDTKIPNNFTFNSAAVTYRV